MQPASRSRLRLYDELFQRVNISPIISRFVNRRLCNECRVRQAKIVEQNLKCFLANASLPDMLMPIQLRSPSRFGVIAVPPLHIHFHVSILGSNSIVIIR
jgi:hypothetical protein